MQGPYRDTKVVEAGSRALPLALRARLVLGHRFTLVAWLLLIGSSVLSWHCAGNSPLGTRTMSAGPRGRAPAVVTDYRTHNGKRGELYRDLFYTYTLPDGQERTGVSYHAHRPAGVGDHYTVEYDLAHPERSRIIGLRETAFESWHVLLALLALPAALGFALAGWFKARRHMKLLAYGQLAPWAQFQSVESTGSGKSRRYFAVHVYDTADGQRRSCREPVSSSRFPDNPGSAAQVLYHPMDDRVAVALGALPGRPTLEGDRIVPGRWPRRVVAAAAVLLVVNALGALTMGMPILDQLYFMR